MTVTDFIEPGKILFKATALCGDRDYKILPKGWYVGLIRDALEELAIHTYFQELRLDFDMPMDNLTVKLPEGCFNIKNVYVFNGTECNIGNSAKVWWKRNYFTEGQGFIANDKGNNNNDPFYGRRGISQRDQTTIRLNEPFGVENKLFYNIQMGNLMLSSSCKKYQKVHIHYNGTGGSIDDQPIIPVLIRPAVEDFVIEQTLLFRIANDADPRRWQALYNIYNARLDKDGYNGSWHTAYYNIQNMNESQRNELNEYLSRAAWGTGY